MDIFEFSDLVYRLNLIPLLLILILIIGVYYNQRIVALFDQLINSNIRHPPLPINQSPTICPTDGRSPQDGSQRFHKFLRENAALFTAIGITGTMLSLIPNYLNNFFGSDWKTALLSNPEGLIAILLVQISLISGAVFILYVSLFIIKDLFSRNFDDIVTEPNSHFFSKDSRLKLLFVFVFLPLVGTIVYFLLVILLLQTDFYLKFYYVLLLAAYLMIISLFSIIFGIIIQPINRIFKAFLIICAICVVGALCYTTYIPVYGFFENKFNTTQNLDYGSAKIFTNTPYFSPYNSTLIGMPLDIDGRKMNISNIDSTYMNFHWTTNYGYFITGNPNNYYIKKVGPELNAPDGSTIFWNYDISDQGKVKPPVKILLRVEDKLTKKIYLGAQFNLTWVDMDNITISSNNFNTGTSSSF